MPVLKSPEVFTTTTTSGLTVLRQQENTELGGYKTDVGINDYTGMNVISSAIELYQVPPSGNPETSLRMTIRLSEAWSDMQVFVDDMKATHKVDVKTMINPFDESKGSLSVSGIKNIEKLVDAFRNTQFITDHQGASIHRLMCNPALLGEAVQTAETMVATYANANHGPGEWSAKTLEYGWRL